MKKKVLFLIHTLQVGGAEKALVNLVNNLDQSKYDITVMTVIDTGAFRFDLDKNIKYKAIFKIPFISWKNKKNNSGNLSSGGVGFLKKISLKAYQSFWRNKNMDRFYRKHIKEEYDVEISYLEGVCAKIIAASNNVKSKKIAWIHVDLLKEKKTEAFFRDIAEEKGVYMQFDKIACVSKTVAESFVKKFDFDEKLVCVKYNIIDSEKIKSLANKKISKNGFTICTVGRLSRQKGYDRLLRVVKRLNSCGLEFNVWIIGVGAEKENLEKYIIENHIENVQLLGYKSNPYPYIKSSDLFVCSSRAEGISTVVSEALILEKPVIATECSGMKELLGGKNECGVICENTENGLFNALLDVLSSDKKYRALCKKSTKSTDMFDIHKTVHDVEEIL